MVTIYIPTVVIVATLDRCDGMFTADEHRMMQGFASYCGKMSDNEDTAADATEILVRSVAQSEGWTPNDDLIGYARLSARLAYRR